MSDWAPGDLALCLTTAPIYDCRCGCVHGGKASPPRGSIRGVVRVEYDPDGCELLLVVGAEASALSRRFRKIRPLSDEEAQQFVADLKVGKPAKVDPVPQPLNHGGDDHANRDRFAPVRSISFHDQTTSPEAQA